VWGGGGGGGKGGADAKKRGKRDNVAGFLGNRVLGEKKALEGEMKHDRGAEGNSLVSLVRTGFGSCEVDCALGKPWATAAERRRVARRGVLGKEGKSGL